MKKHYYEVYVGNIGNAHVGYDEKQANTEFEEYVRITLTNKSHRCYEESVILYCDGKVEREHIGQVDIREMNKYLEA